MEEPSLVPDMIDSALEKQADNISVGVKEGAGWAVFLPAPAPLLQ